MKHSSATRMTVAAITVAVALGGGARAWAEEHDARVRAFVISPRGEVEGVLLSDRATLRFSPAIGEQVAEHVRVGERVQVTRDGMTLIAPRSGFTVDIGLGSLGHIGGGPAGALPPASRAERGAVDGMTVSGATAPVGSQRFTVQGRVAGLSYNRARQLDGVIIAGGITVRVPASQAGALAGLRVGDAVAVEGNGVRGRYGIGIQADRVRDGHGTVLYSAQ